MSSRTARFETSAWFLTEKGGEVDRAEVDRVEVDRAESGHI